MHVLCSTATGIAAGVLSLALAACDEGPSTNVTYRNDDVRQIAHAVMVAGPLPVVIAGVPYDGEPRSLADRVTEDMERAFTWYATPRFDAVVDETANPRLRVVMTFNGGSALGGRDQCRGKATGGGPLNDGRVEVVATFCDEGDVLANVRGWIGRSEGESDPRFSALIRQVTRDMFADAARP